MLPVLRILLLMKSPWTFFCRIYTEVSSVVVALKMQRGWKGHKESVNARKFCSASRMECVCICVSRQITFELNNQMFGMAVPVLGSS